MVLSISVSDDIVSSITFEADEDAKKDCFLAHSRRAVGSKGDGQVTYLLTMGIKSNVPKCSTSMIAVRKDKLISYSGHLLTLDPHSCLKAPTNSLCHCPDFSHPTLTIWKK